jgi:hypothetical protein
VDEVTKVVLGHRMAKLQGQEDELKGILDKKLKELAAVRQLAETYKDNPQFGNASNPLEVGVLDNVVGFSL